MKVALCYELNSVRIDWNLSFFLSFPVLENIFQLTNFYRKKNPNSSEPKMTISKSSTSRGLCIKMANSFQWKFFWGNFKY
jgi:hypothetical protein